MGSAPEVLAVAVTLAPFAAHRNETVTPSNGLPLAACTTPPVMLSGHPRLGASPHVLILLWLNQHRIFTVLMTALALWTGSYAWYLRGFVRKYFFRGRPHNWSVDMASKKAVARGVEEVR
jgi:hypothetical protein